MSWLLELSAPSAWVICVAMICVCVMTIWAVGQFR